MSNPPDPRQEFAREVVARLQAAGFEALWAGGCVRDLLLGRDASDYDVATSATPDKVMQLFRRTIPVGVSFGVVRVLGPRPAGEVEVATFRSDGAYIDGRRPESVVFGSAEVDASRRDFTINGMFLDPITNQVLDYVGGREDLLHRRLRAIGDPSARFREDKLRLLRAVRFAARFGMEIERTTLDAVQSMADQVTMVAAERIAQELRKMLVDRNRARAIDLARDVGLLPRIILPLSSLVGDDGREVVPSAWQRTLGVLDFLPEVTNFPLAFAALMHAITADPGPTLAASEFLRLANHERDRASWLVVNQAVLRAPQSLAVHELKRWLVVDGIEDLLELQRAIGRASDGTCRAPTTANGTGGSNRTARWIRPPSSPGTT
ncbi:MAG: CCA tRNA nucleotidyltransferase [Isosphaeraceae bacterium]